VGQVANLRTDCQSVHPGAARTSWVARSLHVRQSALRSSDIVSYDTRSEGNSLPPVDSKHESIHPSRIENASEEMLRQD
jgi:hypothetical protein